jgi:hypothetical protein
VWGDVTEHISTDAPENMCPANFSRVHRSWVQAGFALLQLKGRNHGLRLWAGAARVPVGGLQTLVAASESQLQPAPALVQRALAA